jgi:hypothetical protein
VLGSNPRPHCGDHQENIDVFKAISWPLRKISIGIKNKVSKMEQTKKLL